MPNLSQDIVIGREQSLQKPGESESSSVMVLGKMMLLNIYLHICELTTYMPYGGGRNNIDASKLLYNCLFFRRDQDFL